MKVKVTFEVDAEIKKKALEKSRQYGITLTFVINQILQAYAEGDFTISIKPRRPHQNFPHNFKRIDEIHHFLKNIDIEKVDWEDGETENKSHP